MPNASKHPLLRRFLILNMKKYLLLLAFIAPLSIAAQSCTISDAEGILNIADSETTTCIVKDTRFFIFNYTLYPNPTYDTFQIIYENAPLSTTLKIYNLSGQIVYIANKSSEFDIAHLPQGLYIVRLENGQTLKLIKQ